MAKMYSQSNFDILNPGRHVYSRRYSFDIDGDIKNANKLRKNSLTGRNAALDVALRSKNGFLNTGTKTKSKTGVERKNGRLVPKKNKQTKKKKTDTGSNVNKKRTNDNQNSDFKIDENVLQDFEDSYKVVSGKKDDMKIVPSNGCSPVMPKKGLTNNNFSFHSNYGNNDLLDDKDLVFNVTDVNDNFSELNLTKEENQSLEASEQDIVAYEKYKLYRFNVIPDGNCLYRAIAQAVYTDDEYHEVLREATVNYIANNIDEFKRIIEEPVVEFLSKAGQDGEWAGYPEILAMTRLLNINISLTTGGSLKNTQVNTTCHFYYDDSEDSENPKDKKLLRQKSCTRPTVWLSWLTSGHYDLFTDCKLPNSKYDAWVKEVNKRNSTDEALAQKLSKEDCVNDKQQRRKTHNPPAYTNINSYDTRPTASLHSLVEDSSNTNCNSQFDFDLLKYSDMYA